MNILAALLCIILFSLTVPFTRIAALETSPETIILLRLIGASVVCLIFAWCDGFIAALVGPCILWVRIMKEKFLPKKNDRLGAIIFKSTLLN